MPTNVVKTPKQERLWEKAKAQARKEGKTKDWAYIMGIFKNMGGLEKKAGFIGNVFGKNIGKAKAEVNALKGQMKHTQDTMNKATNIFGNRKFSDSATRKVMKEDYEKLRDLKGKVRDEQLKTLGARTKAMLGAGAIGGAAYSGNKLMENRNTGNNDEFKPQYLASHNEWSIEKIAKAIIMKKASVADKSKKIFDALKGMPAGLRGIASLNMYREALKDYDALLKGVRSPDTGRTVSELLDLKDSIQKLQKRNARISNLASGYSSPRMKDYIYGNSSIKKMLDSASGQKASEMKDRLSIINARKKKSKMYSDLAEENKKILELAGNKYRAGEKDIQRMHDIELAKVLGLYGGMAGLAGYGIHKRIKDKKSKT